MELYYQIALTNVPFDNSYKNVLRFNNRSEQETYFNVSSLFSSSRPFVNFNVGSLLTTTITYDCLATDSINELLSKNYCIVKDNSPTKQLDYYYYFITNAKQENENRISLTIELDVMQTYYINLAFTDCIINRADLNRFIQDPDDNTKVLFDGGINSKLFEREPIQNVAKGLTKRTNVGIYNTGDSAKDSFFNNNILGWLYVYLDPTQEYKFLDASGENVVSVKLPTMSIANYNIRNSHEEIIEDWIIPQQFSCLAIPVYKKEIGNFLSIEANADVTKGYVFAPIALTEFIERNSADYIYSVKFSIVPPFFDYEFSYRFISTHYLNINGTETTNSIDFEVDTANNKMHSYRTGGSGVLLVERQIAKNFQIITKSYNLDAQFKFNKNEIIGSSKDVKFNPKLLGADYRALSISDITENGFEYDVQKLNKNNFDFKFYEPLTPDISRRFICINNPNGLYINETNNNLTGFIGVNDNSLTLALDQYKTMLANNKNFWLQKATNAFTFTGQQTISSQKTRSKAIGALGQIGDAIDTSLTIDNLKNAPAVIHSAKGDLFFENMYSENGIIVEEYDILPNEKEMINDYMSLFGFTYNRLGNVKDFDNIRKYHNFIKADIEQVEAVGININDNVHSKLKQIYANGVRFWNTDTFSYNLENYENWLEGN